MPTDNHIIFTTILDIIWKKVYNIKCNEGVVNILSQCEIYSEVNNRLKKSGFALNSKTYYVRLIYIYKSFLTSF